MVGLKPSEVPPTLMVKFVGAGTAACIADLLTFPLDTAKVRLQVNKVTRWGEGSKGRVRRSPSVRVVQYKGVMGTISTMVKMEGAGQSLQWAGGRAAAADDLRLYPHRDVRLHSGVTCRLLAGSTTGALAVTCAQPTDVVKVRFQADIRVIDGHRRYNGTVDAYKTIAKEEGVRGLWKGTVPNITRNAIVNCAELVTYDLIKEAILTRQLMTDNLPCHFVAAFGAGFCTTVVASPVDVVKTRYMKLYGWAVQERTELRLYHVG
ncbi:unnamed protein product [Ranitomeya imitator]|uniref:Uncharacterized protein n=1 Tax=Ranitomeya imitator TaxID=111125 RepID=A0ABN9L5I6_9NEOB|nr:unnamed protein product [Ranitomeya imitator]